MVRLHIGTDQVVTASTADADRALVTSFLNRSDVAQKLQSMGLSAKSAQDRVASLSDQEVQQIAARIDSLPAGGDAVGIVLLILVLAAIWYVWRGGFR